MGKYRFSFLAGLATGYVLGARAGRDRYEQIMKAARTFAENPTVQQAAGAVQSQATGIAAAAGSKISDGVRDRVPGLRHNGHGSHEANGGKQGEGADFTGAGRRDRGNKDEG
jgi:hypothetical protein